MADLSDLVARVRAAREHWFELDSPPRRAVKWRLPDWEETLRLGMRGLEPMRVVVGLVVDWRGFTQADFEAGAEPRALEFSAALWELALAEQVDMVSALTAHVAKTVNERAKARQASSGN